jgi:PhoH-like ATPase
MNKDVLVLDTSALINHPNIFSLVDDSTFIVPIEVLEELDNAKVKNDTTGFNARRANRAIDEIRAGRSLIDGVSFGRGNILKVSMESDLSLVPSFFSQNTDSRIISVAKKYDEESIYVKLVSADISLRIKASSLGINSISDDDLLFGKEDLLYSGCKIINTESENIADFYRDGFVDHTRVDLYPNQAVVLKAGESSSAIGVVKGNKIVKLKADKKDSGVMGMSPRNKEQRFAMEYLLDQDIPMVSLAGVAGTGKTSIAAVTAMHMLDKGMYEKLILCRPAVSASAGIGFLPGTLEEKMMPWIQPIFDNLKHMMKCSDMYLNLLMEKKKIEIASLSYIRGRTFPNTIVIVDEAQNSNPSEMKAIITRMGDKSKLIITGDLEQIDSPKLDIYSSGLSIVANKFKQSPLAAHITLQKTERSELAALAAKLL